MQDIRFSENINLKIDTIGFLRLQRKGGFTFEHRKGKDKFSFIYIERGMVDYCFSSNQTIHVEKGNLIYIPKHISYKTTYLVDNTIIRMIVFDADAATILPPSPCKLQSADTSSVFESISSFNAYNSLYLTSKAYELLYIIQNETKTIPKKYVKILPALNEIKFKYYENNKVSHYAEMCNMSEANFRKLVKEYTGYSPIDYRNHIRITEVNRMLESGGFTIADAAYFAGFNNMSFFYTLYRKASKD